MSRWKENTIELEERPDELVEENQELELEIPDVYWAKDIREIEHPILREREIEAAKRLYEKEQELDAKIESGELTGIDSEIKWSELRKQKAAASTRAGLASEGLTWDHLAEISEDWDVVSRADIGLIDLTDRLRQTIDKIGPENAQQLADELFEKGELSKETYDYISRKARLSSLK